MVMQLEMHVFNEEMLVLLELMLVQPLKITTFPGKPPTNH